MISFLRLAGLSNFKSADLLYVFVIPFKLKKMDLRYYLFFLLLCHGCVDDSNLKDFEYKLIVEGRIEEGNVPYVILTQSKPLLSNIDSTSMEDMVVRWAKVSVSDGEKTEVLSGRIDKNYFPPFVYRGMTMLGEAGKTYTLKVEYSGRTWTAETIIPESVPLKNIQTIPLTGNDTLFSIEATFNDPGDTKNYYKFYTKLKSRNSRYMPALMGNLDDNLFNGQSITIGINQGIDQTQSKDFDSNFNIRDTVSVKFCTQTEFGFRYWTAYENELINGQNPFFPANQNLPTNINNDALGIWCGYGEQTYEIIFQP